MIEVQKVGNFLDDRAFTDKSRELLERDIYPQLAWQGRWCSLLGQSGGAQHLQRVAHIDAVVQTGPHSTLTVEEKIARKKYDALAIEFQADTRSPSPDGWIYASTADLLIYAFKIQGGLEAHIFTLAKMREWFEQNGSRYPLSEVKNGWGGEVKYYSRCRIVPIRDIPGLLWTRTLMW